jgi:hypothetical protein
MLDGVFYLLIFILLVGLVVLALWITRESTGFNPAKLMPKKPMKRLALVETRYLDSKRRLLLVRRDNVEHLVITGGPVDMILETGIPVPSNADHGVSNTVASKDSERTNQSDLSLSLQPNGTGSSIPAPVPAGFHRD